MDKLSGEPTVSSIILSGKRRVNSTYPDGSEMVEEYDINTNECLIRKIKLKREFGASDWKYEIGHEEAKFDPEADSIKLNHLNPIFLRKDSEGRFEWRIRNLPYPKEVYSISVDHDKQQIVLRTSNKKYFKRIDIPEMKKLGIQIQDESVSWKYSNNTLLIGYTKPPEVIKAEKEKVKMIVKGSSGSVPQEGNVECNNQ